MFIKAFLLFLCGLLFPDPGRPENYPGDIVSNQNNDCIKLIINNIRNKSGVIRVGLYNSDIHYPDSAFQSFIIPKVTMDSGRLTWIIPLEKHGIYAISILDDENNNGKMDYRLGFLPREGFGFSNNPGIKTLSVPAYNTVSFPFNGGRKIISVNMVYIL